MANNTATITDKKFVGAEGVKVLRKKNLALVESAVEVINEALDQKQDVIQHDTAAGWLKQTTFSPAKGQFIVYDKDDEHDYARLKVGDGVTLVSQLPFVDAGTLNGKTLSDLILRFATKGAFPSIGSSDSFYLDLSDRQLYTWNGGSGYIPVSALPDAYEPVTVQTVQSWDAGKMTILEAKGSTLFVSNGSEPTLVLASHTILHRMEDE